MSIKEYKKYDEFKLDVVEPIKKIMELQSNIPINRTGLRYVNIFTNISEFLEIKQKFHPMVSSSFENMVDLESCSRNLLITEYIYDEIKLRMQTGIYNSDYPAKIKKKEFIIDLDAYMDTPHIVSDVSGFFDDLHGKIQHLFEEVITNDLRGILDE